MRTLLLCAFLYATNAELVSISQCADGSALTTWVNEAVASATYGLGDLLVTNGLNVGGTQRNAGSGNIKVENHLETQSLSVGTGSSFEVDSTGIRTTKDAIFQGITGTSITVDQITVDQITFTGLGAIATGAIATGAITNEKVAANAITKEKIADNAITKEKIADNAVGASQIIGGSITNTELDNGDFTMNTVTIGNSLYAADKAFRVLDDDIAGGYTTCSMQLKGWIKISNSPTGTQSKGTFKSAKWMYYIRSNHNGVLQDGGWTTNKISIDADGAIFSMSYIGASDRRIKKDIRPLKDGESLKILRRLDTVVYKYKDELSRGGGEVIGFIAQDVNETIPSATTTLTQFIPDEMRIVRASFKHLPSGRWEMKLRETLAPGRYRFIMETTNDEDDAVELSTEDGSTFIVEKEYKEEMVLYGKEVDDFLAIDKQKIFAVAYSALQQVDKNQIVLQQKVASLEETIAKLSERLAALDGQS